MWIPRNAERHGVVERLIAVAIDKDNGSQYALKWAVDYLVTKGQTLVLVHVNVKSGSHSSALHSNPSNLSLSLSLEIFSIQQLFLF